MLKKSNVGTFLRDPLKEFYSLTNINYEIIKNEISELKTKNNKKIIDKNDELNDFQHKKKYVDENIKNNNNLDQEHFSKNEEIEAKKNGFILFGTTGSGKTTLLNVLFGKQVDMVYSSPLPVTGHTNVYYYKLKNEVCISIIDTPGFYTKDLNEIYFNEIINILREREIQIKGLLYLINFQSERMDCSEQENLLYINSFFPLKRFWKNMLFIFTHFFCDPYGDDFEEMIKLRNKTNSRIIYSIMERVTFNSDIIDINEIKMKYFNSYCPVKTNRQLNQNNKVRNELEEELIKFISIPPLFSKIEILHEKDYITECEGKKYSCELEVIGFFDFNYDMPINKKTRIISMKEINQYEDTKSKKDKNNCLLI